MTRSGWQRAAFASLCTYEAFSVSTGLTPTVSQLCRRRRWVEAGLLAFLLLHLHYAREGSSRP